MQFRIQLPLKLEVPHLEDDESHSKAWVFDAIQKKQLIHRLFTAMSGSVVADPAAKCTSGGGKKRKALAKTKPKTGTKKAKTGNSGDTSILPEPDVNNIVVDCEYGVRNKLWVDDLIACATHTVRSLRVKFTDLVDEPLLDKAKISIIRLGLRFAFCGSVSVPVSVAQVKKFSKWSLLRPALQTHGIFVVTQARSRLPLCFEILDSYVQFNGRVVE